MNIVGQNISLKPFELSKVWDIIQILSKILEPTRSSHYKQ